MEERKYSIPQPPKEIFKYRESLAEGILRETPVAYEIDRFEIEQGKGIQVYYKDIPVPRKGYPTPEAVAAVNTIKRLFMSIVKLMVLPEFMIAWFINIFSPFKVKTKDQWGKIIKVGRIQFLITSFNRISYGHLSHHMIQPGFMTPLASELQGIIFTFLARMGIEQGIARQFAIIFGTIIQYDNAYLLRIQDLFTSSSKEALIENPYKESKRLFKIFMDREQMWIVKDKFRFLFKLISLPLLLPKVKNAFKSAMRTCDYDRLKFDENDRWWAYLREDYNFDGKTHKERMKGRINPPGLYTMTHYATTPTYPIL
jgi:hypothetical protein